MNAIVALAFLASAICTASKGYRKAFLYVYIPVLVCLPSWGRWVLPALPDPTFQQAAILPIAAVSFYRDHARLSKLDYLVISFLVFCGISEFINAGYADAQNLMFDMICSGILPYLISRKVLASKAERTEAIRIFVLCTSGVVVTAVYESKFGSNPFRLFFDPFFPGQGDGWVTTFRYGLARAAGPYAHAILAGIMFMIALQLQCWLHVCGLWKANLALTRLVGRRLSVFLTCWNLFGLLLTWVRGPQLGALLAWVVFRVSRGRNAVANFRRALIAFAIGIVPLSVWFYSYVSVGRAAAVTAGQESAAYRKELLEKYAVIVFTHLWFGWGKNGWPKVPGMPSIDNYYLLIALMHGLPALTLLVTVLILVSVKLFRRGIATAQRDSEGSALSFTLFSIYIGLGFSLATVYMGENVFVTFFFLLGLSEALLQERLTVRASAPVLSVSRPGQLPRFRRVLA